MLVVSEYIDVSLIQILACPLTPLELQVALVAHKVIMILAGRLKADLRKTLTALSLLQCLELTHGLLHADYILLTRDGNVKLGR